MANEPTGWKKPVLAVMRWPLWQRVINTICMHEGKKLQNKELRLHLHHTQPQILMAWWPWRLVLCLCNHSAKLLIPSGMITGEKKKKKDASQLFLTPSVCFGVWAWVWAHVCVKPWYPEPQTINGGVRTKQEAGMAQGDRLLGPSLAAAGP